MRVIHLIGGGDTGGAKTHVLNLLKELNQSIDAQLFCFRKGDFSEDAAKMGIPIEVIESGNPVVGLRELKRRLAGQKVDIIHCHGARGNLMGNLVKKHLGPRWSPRCTATTAWITWAGRWQGSLTEPPTWWPCGG